MRVRQSRAIRPLGSLSAVPGERHRAVREDSAKALVVHAVPTLTPFGHLLACICLPLSPLSSKFAMFARVYSCGKFVSHSALPPSQGNLGDSRFHGADEVLSAFADWDVPN